MPPLRVAVTVDFEPDCPPWLTSGYRGVCEGGPALLDLLGSAGVAATYFTTGDVAERFPDAVREVVRAGHELGSHGVTHAPFDRMTDGAAREEIHRSVATLREFSAVTAFRAPYLRFPERLLPELVNAGITVDCSLAKYKASYLRRSRTPPLRRIAASVTSSVLRLPRRVREPWLRLLSDPVVLFVHPWEFVDLTAAPIRYDCRFNTGATALTSLRDVLAQFSARGAHFVTIRDLVASGTP
jgi:peptidoglycan/xylan/chitin deacetylase (PgdA/CDA1 family)